MSTVTSCNLLGLGAPPTSSSGGRFLGPWKAAAVVLPGFQRKSSSLCFAHNPKADLQPFSISPFALVHPVPTPREERWHMKEDAETVSMEFDVPGLSNEDLVVELDEDVLVIRKKLDARRDSRAEETHDGGAICARLLVPAGYSREDVKARLASGVLTVTIAKVKRHARRKINVDIQVIK